MHLGERDFHATTLGNSIWNTAIRLGAKHGPGATTFACSWPGAAANACTGAGPGPALAPTPPPPADGPLPAPTPAPVPGSGITITSPQSTAAPPLLAPGAPGTANGAPGPAAAAPGGFFSNLFGGFTGLCCGNGLCGGLLGNRGAGNAGDPAAAAGTGLTIGGGVYFMMPYFSSNPAFFSKSGTSTHEQDFSNRVSVAPTGDIIYYFTPEWGVKFRWWQITTNGSATGPSGTVITDPSGFGPGMATTPGSTVTANSNLFLSVWNFEVAHKWIFGCNCNSWLEMSGGWPTSI